MAEDADRLVARAIESVLDQVPGGADAAAPELASAKLQPWAETAAPVGARGKRPLEELLVELAARVEQHPGAIADIPHTRHPAVTFFERFSGRVRSATDRDPAGEPGTGRRRRRGRGGGRAAEPAASASPPVNDAEPGGTGGRRRSRRGRGRGGASRSGDAGGVGAASLTPPPKGQTPPGSRAGEPRPPGAGRRRRGRRGRGGGAGAAPS